MVLNYIWIAFFLLAAVCAIIQCFLGNSGVFADIIGSTFENAKTAFEISIGLTGVLSLWMGIMKIGEKGGMVSLLSKALSPLFTRLFPDIPKGHPATGHIFMNIAANMLGLDNAATPLGLKAMESMQELNKSRNEGQGMLEGWSAEKVAKLNETASNSMIMFLVLNTSGLTIIPVSIMVYRAQMGAAQPTDIFVPILLATFVATLAGIIITSIYQRINLFQPVLIGTLGGMCLLVAAMIWGFSQMDKETMDMVSTLVANIILFGIMLTFIIAGMVKKVNVYETFIEGAKDGFTTAVRVIPYLVAILIAIGVFRASGGMDILIRGINWLVELCGGNTDFVAALPTALMKPLSGSGARGMMVDTMTIYGPDSFAGRLACIFQGSTDTTFYILAVYFGSVGIRHTRHAVTCGLLADLFGILAAIAVAYFFFG
ncbi:MAG: spore maturation protein [Bacteroidaceae bacterium]|nr:spore maturation protein [Bacteroidaceae bacterium]